MKEQRTRLEWGEDRFDKTVLGFSSSLSVGHQVLWDPEGPFDFRFDLITILKLLVLGGSEIFIFS